MAATRGLLLALALLAVGAAVGNFTETCFGLRRQACLAHAGAAWNGTDCSIPTPEVWPQSSASFDAAQLPLYKYRYLSTNVTKETQRIGSKVVVMIGDSTVRNQFMHLALHLLPNCTWMTLASCVVLRKQEKSGFWRSNPPIRSRVHDQDHGFWGSFYVMRATSAFGFTAIYYRSHACYNAKVISHLIASKYLAGAPDAIMYNVGAHNLHVYPASRVSPDAHELGCLLNMETFLHRTIGEFRDGGANPMIVWRTSTAFCESNWGGQRKDLIGRYQCRAGNATEQEAVYASCQQHYQISALDCARSLLGHESVMLHREQAVKVLREQYPDVGLLDSYQLTQSTCHLSDPSDAIHRVKLLNHINLAFLRELQRLDRCRTSTCA